METGCGTKANRGAQMRALVVGSGVSGIEYASMFAALGIAVTLVEKRDRPLEFLDREIVEELMHQMRDRNVTFRLGEAVARLEISEGPPRRAVVLLESGKRIVADMVLFSVGRLGATEGLNLEAAGLTCDERSRMVVDEEFRTRVPHIFAVGDPSPFPNFRRPVVRLGPYPLGLSGSGGVDQEPPRGPAPPAPGRLGWACRL